MIETITTVIETSPELIIGMVMGLFVLYPMASISDKTLGQPRKEGKYDEKRETKVKKLYFRLGVLSIIIVVGYAATKVGLV